MIVTSFFLNIYGLAKTPNSFECHHLQNDFYSGNNLNQTFEVSQFYLNILFILHFILNVLPFYLNQIYLWIQKYHIYWLILFLSSLHQVFHANICYKQIYIITHFFFFFFFFTKLLTLCTLFSVASKGAVVAKPVIPDIISSISVFLHYNLLFLTSPLVFGFCFFFPPPLIFYFRPDLLVLYWMFKTNAMMVSMALTLVTKLS